MFDNKSHRSSACPPVVAASPLGLDAPLPMASGPLGSVPAMAPMAGAAAMPVLVEQPVRPRGFAALDQDRRRAIASAGGKAAHERGNAHEFTSEEARNAGRKGGKSISQDRKHMATIGSKGGMIRGERQRDRVASAI